MKTKTKDRGTGAKSEGDEGRSHGRSTGRTPKRLYGHLGAYGSGLSTGQAKFRTGVTEELAPPPTKGLMATALVADIAGKMCSLNVGEHAKHP
jgi:hypothetical protein